MYIQEQTVSFMTQVHLYSLRVWLSNSGAHSSNFSYMLILTFNYLLGKGGYVFGSVG